MSTPIKPPPTAEDMTVMKAALESLRLALLRLHKTLLDDERIQFEKTMGPVASPHQLLNLVLSDPWFDWLHKISRTIVRIDEINELEHPGEVDAAGLKVFEDVSKMVRPSDAPDDDFMRRYKDALRRNPGSVLSHAEVLKALHRQEMKATND